MVYVEAPGFVPGGRFFAEGSAPDCDFVLSRGFSVGGIVTDSSGTPLVGAVVRLRRDPFYSPVPHRTPAAERMVRFRFSKQARTAPDGTWQLEGIEAGFYVLEGSLSGHSTESTSGFEVPHQGEVRIVLRGGAEIVGRVTEEDSGRPVAYAYAGVFYPPPGGGEVYEEDGPDTRTDEQGRFVLHGVRTGTEYVRLRIDRQSYVTVEKVESGLSPGEVRERNLGLKKACFLRGRVEEEDGRPVAGVELFVELSSSHGLVRGDTTNDRGTFQIPRLAPGVPLLVQIEAEGFTPLEVRNIVPPRDDLVLKLRRTGGLEIEVRAQGRPVPSFTCELYEELRHVRRTVRTETCQSEQGRLSLRNLPASTYGVLIEAAEHAPGRIESVRVEPGSSATLRVDLAEGRTVTGRVLDRSTDAPLPGIRVAASKTSRAGMVHGTVGRPSITDARGEFVLEHLSDEEGTLVFTRGGRAVARVPYKLQGSGETRIPDVPIGAEAVVHGVVVGPSGRPLSGARVAASPFLFAERREIQTEADGAYRLEAASGRTRVFVVPPPTLPSEWLRSVHDRVVDLEPGESRRIDFDLTAKGAVTGNVTYRGEALQVSAFVDLRDPETGLRQVGGSYLDPGARYTIPSVPAGRHFVLCRTLDPILALDSMREVTVADGETVRCDFDLQGGGIEGVLRTPNGEAPTSPSVVLKPLHSGTGGGIRLPAFVEPDGSFASLGLAEGNYRLEARAASCAPAVLPKIEVPADRAVRADIDFEPEARLAVSARRLDASPAAEVEISLHRPGDPQWPLPAPLLTGADGTANFGGLASGLFEVEANGEGLFPLRVPISLRSGESLRLDLPVRRRGDLEVLARGTDGAPRVGVTLSVVDQATGIDARQWVAAGLVRASDGGLRTDASGRLTLEGLPEGTFRVFSGGSSTLILLPGGGAASTTLALP